jgi:two-component system sensor histidine kinase YesM
MYSIYEKFIPSSGSCRTINIIRKLDNIGKKDIEKVLKIDIDYNAMLMDVLNEKIDGAIYVRNAEYVLFSNLPNTSGMKTYDLAKSIEEKDSTITTTFQQPIYILWDEPGTQRIYYIWVNWRAWGFMGNNGE